MHFVADLGRSLTPFTRIPDCTHFNHDYPVLLKGDTCIHTCTSNLWCSCMKTAYKCLKTTVESLTEMQELHSHSDPLRNRRQSKFLIHRWLMAQKKVANLLHYIFNSLWGSVSFHPPRVLAVTGDVTWLTLQFGLQWFSEWPHICSWAFMTMQWRSALSRQLTKSTLLCFLGCSF